MLVVTYLQQTAHSVLETYTCSTTSVQLSAHQESIRRYQTIRVNPALLAVCSAPTVAIMPVVHAQTTEHTIYSRMLSPTDVWRHVQTANSTLTTTCVASATSHVRSAARLQQTVHIARPDSSTAVNAS